MLMAAPGTKYLYKDLTGMVHIHAYDAHLRVTSTVQAVVSSMDLEKEGFDAFIAPDATDAASTLGLITVCKQVCRVLYVNHQVGTLCYIERDLLVANESLLQRLGKKPIKVILDS